VPSLVIDTQLVVFALPDGATLAYPLADPSLAELRRDEPDPAGAFADLLTLYLDGAPPETLARFATPPGTRIETVSVALERSDLPASLRALPPVPFHCVVTPLGADRWIHVLGLDHVFLLAPDAPLAATVADEISRLVRALELDPHALLALLPLGEPQLVALELPLLLGPTTPADATDLRRRVADAARARDALAVLTSVATPVHLDPQLHDAPPLTGRDRDLAALDALLSGRERQSVLLVAPELAGKSALLRGWLRSAWQRDPRPTVFATSGARLIAGMSGLGQWQARVTRVMEAAATLDAVLWFENLGDLFGTGTSSREDLASALRPWLDQRKVRVLGELRPEAVTLYERRHGGLFAALQRVALAPLSADDTAAALVAQTAHDAEHAPDRPRLTPDAVPAVVALCDRYLPYRAFPGKAFRLVDELRVLHADDRTPDGAAALITRARVHAGFSLMSGIPPLLLRDDQPLDLERVAAFFHARIIGQRPAVSRVVEALAVIKAGLQPRGKPLATLLFAGPTGVGKTELARTLAAFLFGSPERLARFDMSEFMDPWAADRLIRGTDRDEGVLTRRVRQSPFSVLLLDEIEKAHASVFDLLLQVLGEGRLTDGRGRTASFENALVIMTSNLGVADHRRAIGLTPAADDDTDAHYQRAVALAFRPELVNRIDRIIPFAPLTPDEIAAVTRLAVAEVASRRGLGVRRIALDVTPDALAALARGGYSERYGARALNRHLETALVAPVATELIARSSAGEEVTAVTVDVASDTGALRVRGVTAGDATPHWQQGAPRRVAIGAIQEVRRRVDRVITREPLAELADRRDHLAAQLVAAPSAPHLAREHAHLARALDAAYALRDEIHLVEELAITALTDLTELRDHLARAHDLERALLHQIFGLLARDLSDRDTLVVMLSELTPRAFDGWLPELLFAAADRRWELRFHLRGQRGADLAWDPAALDATTGRGRRPAAPAIWPAARPWHPPVSADALLDWLDDREPPHSHLVMTVRGRHVGLLLQLEAGLYRWHRGDPRDRDPNAAGAVLMRPLALGPTLPDAAWDAAALIPPTPDTYGALATLPPVRVFDLGAGLVTGPDGRDTLPRVPTARYWHDLEALVATGLLDRVDRGDLDALELPPFASDDPGEPQ